MLEEAFLINEHPKFAQKLLAQYSILQKLGQGAFSQVYKVIDKEQQIYAIKVIDKQHSAAILDKLQQEAYILSILEHENIVKFYKILESKRKYYFILECIEGVPLSEDLKWNEDHIRTILTQILEAIAYIHSKGIIHRDLKPDNIIIDKQMHIKIIDFGLSFQTTKQTSHENCGTLLFMAPEAIMKKEYFKSIDIWSCGIIQYILFNQRHPFWDHDNRDSYILKMKQPQKADCHRMSKAATSFFERTAAYMPESRITAEQALQHIWITGINDDQILTSKEMMDAFKKSSRLINLVKTLMLITYISQKGQRVTYHQMKKIVSTNTLIVPPTKRQYLKVPTPNRSCMQTRFNTNETSFISEASQLIKTPREKERTLRLPNIQRQDVKLPPINKKNMTNSPQSKSFIFSPQNKTMNMMDMKKSQFRFK